MTATAERRETMTPSFLAALALHAAVFLVAMLTARTNLAPMGAAVPITIVSSAPTTDSRPAEAAPDTKAAQTETPVPLAKAPTPPPAALPVPRPPTPTPPTERKPTSAPTPHPVKVPAKPTPQVAPAKDNFLDSVAANIRQTSKTTPQRQAFAARGQAQAETAPQARVDAGQGVSQSNIAGLAQLLNRLWNPNCDAPGAGAIVIPLHFTVGPDGHVLGGVTVAAGINTGDPVVSAAVRRAIDAVHRVEPYEQNYRSQTFTVKFNARTACANG